MFKRIGILLALVTLRLTLAHPFTFHHNQSLLLHRASALEGSCSTIHLPTEEQYTLGYETFCSTYLAPDKQHLLSKDNALVATLYLTAFDNTPLRWVYKVSLSDHTLPLARYILTQDMCIEAFRGVLETNDAGGLGKGYCVVDGTGGDKLGVEGMSGEGVVLVKGGKVIAVESDGGFGEMWWETRGRLDD
ncbi:hypothetical protein BKA66DRAFT_408695 [Pyrenochaeta sp. MPI-SDFR-AT-0127]|nr:hypothetical protein BKA66DRAFT_408695 [Pyrenochaeta sp. MPI-SDFR-AT-0127]